MDDAHLIAAVRYVENNPVAAGMTREAGDWRWSSARSHLNGRRAKGDPLTDVAALGAHVPNWRACLRLGADAAGDATDAETIEARLRTGRPLADADWIAEREARIARKLGPMKRGPRGKRDGDGEGI